MSILNSLITVFATPQGSQCNRVKTFLKEFKIPFQVEEIAVNKELLRKVNEAAESKHLFPAIKIDDTMYHNPSDDALKDLLGINDSGEIVTMLGAEWCPDCHRAKAFLGDHNIRFRYINIDHHDWAPGFLEKVNNGKRIIPTIVINDAVFANPDNRILRDVLDITIEKESKLYDVAIIGGGAAGLTAAIYVQRDRYDSIILEKKNIGGNAYLTEKIENYPGFMNISGTELMDRMADQARFYGAHIQTGTDVRRVNKSGNVFYLETNLGEVKAKSVIIATGSSYRKLRIPGEEDLIGKGIHFCATCDGAFYRDKEVLVVGGGNSALEESLFLTRFARNIKLVHRAPDFSASETYIQKIKETDKIETFLDVTPIKFLQNEDGTFQGLLVRNNKSNDEKIIKSDGAFVFIGLVPNSKTFKNLVELNGKGFIKTLHDGTETPLEGVFAAGDVREGAIAQVAAATGEGVAASYAVKSYLKRVG
jgi:thioredoxin reductase (NADPH)